MTLGRAVFPAIAIGFMFLASAASGQQPRAPQAEARPARPADAQGLDGNTAAQAAEEGLAKLEADAGRLKAKLKAEFQNGPEWKAAVEAVKQTAKDCDAARKAVVAKLRAKAEYAQAAAAHQKARQAYDALTDRPGDKQNRERLGEQVQAARTAMGKLETAELNADPEVQKTKQAMLKAQADLAGLKKRLATVHENHPEWIAHQKQIEAARKTLADAQQVYQQQAYTTQARAEREARDALDRQRDETLTLLQQEVLRQQIILTMQQQALAAAQAQCARAPQMNTLGQSPVTGPRYYADADHCVPRRAGSRYYYRPVGPPTPSMNR